MRNTQRRGRRGNSIIEVTLLTPWIFFLFVGVLDFGFYSYAFISTENAARSAVLVTSRSKLAATDQSSACTIVQNELKMAAYGRSFGTCAAAPLVVKATLLSGTGEDGTDAAQVEVIYTTETMIPIPGIVAKSFAVDRKWQAKIDPEADF